MYLDEPLLTLNSHQLARYLHHVGLRVVDGQFVPITQNGDSHDNIPSLEGEKLPPPNLETLTTLKRAHVTHFTFGNVGVLYFDPELPNNDERSRDGVPKKINRPPPMVDLRVNLNLNDLIYKLMERNLAGFCYEQNTLFAAVLRAFNFDPLWSGSARVTTEAMGLEYGLHIPATTHMVNFWIDSEGTQYLIDVGFGSSAPLEPLPIQLNKEFHAGLPNEIYKFTLEPLSPVQTRRPKSTPLSGGRTDQGQTWMLNYTRDGLDGWQRLYAFTDEEVYHADFINLSKAIYCVSSPAIFASNIIASRPTPDFRGRVTLINDKLKVLQDGKSVEDRLIETEAERQEILEEYFGIRLTAREIEAIGLSQLSLDTESGHRTVQVPAFPSTTN
ncbi:uncharacterized protein VTP21DRAFT_10763 [Calcarisporiella thermophila]|uniref:uncharacterized protein n=1 Tax=Calcarisporiella thermophila TaxID=911321 RepID=UPI003742BE13